jgi:hypothetical protein
MAMTRWGCIAIIAIGCGHAAPPAPTPERKPAVAIAIAIDAGVIDAIPKPLDEDLPRLAERALALWQAWAGALAEADGDCAAATTKLNTIADSNADVFAANAKISRAGRETVKALRAALEVYDEQMEAAAKAIAKSPTMTKCQTDPAFARASERVGAEP